MAPRKHEPLDPTWLQREYWERGRSLPDIGLETGRSPASVRDEMQRHGIACRAHDDEHVRMAKANAGRGRRKYNLDPEVLRREYWDNDKGMPQIAQELGVPTSAITNEMTRAGIPTRGVAEARALGRTPLPLEDLVRRYEAGESRIALARRYGVREGTIKVRLVAAGIEPRDHRTAAQLAASRRRRKSGERVRPSEATRLAIVNQRCLICGTEEALEVHHLNGDRSDSSKGNLVPLCAVHHALIEWLVAQALKGLNGMD